MIRKRLVSIGAARPPKQNVTILLATAVAERADNQPSIANVYGDRLQHRRPMNGLRRSMPLAALGILFVTAWDSTAEARVVDWGRAGDVPLPADYDGDGKDDIAIWRPSDGMWHIINSSDGSTSRSAQWGLPGDVPMTTDFDGDGKTDLAVFRPSTRDWHIMESATNTYRGVNWGLADDIPVAADYDADGKSDIAIWRPSDGMWHIIKSWDGTTRAAQLGALGDVPMPGSFDAYPGADFAVWRPSTRSWWTRGSSPVSVMTGTVLGTPGDVPVVASWCYGESIALWNTISGDWNVLGQVYGPTQWGAPGDVPVPIYDGTRPAKKAVFRPSEGRWYILDASHTDICIN